MSLCSAAFNGIGSGAGVAWPLFGIVFSLVGGPIGSCLSLTLGILSSILFLLVTFTIFYLSYKEMKDKKNQFLEKYVNNQNKLIHKMESYLSSISRKQNTEEAIVQDLLNAEKQGNPSSLNQILGIITQVYKGQRNVNLDNKTLIQYVSKVAGSELHIPTYQCFISAFFGFVGTFGSIAGCSAGISGLLSGLGLFTTFATFPFLGWGILGTAFIFGIVIAIETVYSAREDFQLRALDSKIKKMRHQLDKIIIEHQVDSTLQHTLASLSINQEEEKIAFTQLKKPIIQALHKNRVQDNPYEEKSNQALPLEV